MDEDDIKQRLVQETREIYRDGVRLEDAVESIKNVSYNFVEAIYDELSEDIKMSVNPYCENNEKYYYYSILTINIVMLLLCHKQIVL